VEIDEKSKGLVAFFNYGVKNVEKESCGSVPSSYSEKDYGGVVEYISMEAIKTMVIDALNQGMLNVVVNW
jgi:hypothetical protein